MGHGGPTPHWVISFPPWSMPKGSPPAPPLRDDRRLGPYALRPEPLAKARCASAQVGAIPVADHPVQPFGKVTNLNQDLTWKVESAPQDTSALEVGRSVFGAHAPP